MRALCKAAAACGYFLAAEQDPHGNPLTHAFGGAYELAYYDGRRFIKASVTFADLSLDRVAGEAITLHAPYRIMKSHYQDGFLFIHTARFVRTGPDEGLWAPDVYVVGPTFSPGRSELPQIEPEDIGFDSDITQLHLRLGLNEKVLSLSFAEPRPSRMRVVQEGPNLDFRYDDDCRASIERSLVEWATSVEQ